MTVPDTISGAGGTGNIGGGFPSGQSCHGPFVAPNGSWYGIGFVDDAGNSVWRAVMYKAPTSGGSPDPTGTWTAIGASTTQANQPTVPDGKATDISISGVLVGSKVYVAYNNGSGYPTVRWFDTATDTWGTTTASLFTIHGAGSVGAPSIAVNANGGIGVAIVDTSGGLYITVCTSANLSTLTFTSAGNGVQLHSIGGGNAVAGSQFLVGGTGNRFHALVVDQSAGPYFCTLNDGGTAGTQTLVAGAAGSVGVALATRNAGGGVIKVRGVAVISTDSTARWLAGDSADNLVPTITSPGLTFYSTSVIGTLSYRTTDTLWYLFYDTASNATAFRTLNDAGGALSAATSLYAEGMATPPSVASTVTRFTTESVVWIGRLTTHAQSYIEYPLAFIPLPVGESTGPNHIGLGGVFVNNAVRRAANW